MQELKIEWVKETNQQQVEWNAHRFLTKRNYSFQTEAVKQVLLPQSTYKMEDQWIEYASEADILLHFRVGKNYPFR